MSNTKETFGRVDLILFGIQLEALLVTDQLGWVAHVFTPSGKFKLEDIKSTDSHFSDIAQKIFGFLKDIEDYVHLEIKNVSVAKIKVPVVFEPKTNDFFSDNDERELILYNKQEPSKITLRKSDFNDRLDEMKTESVWTNKLIQIDNLESLNSGDPIPARHRESQSQKYYAIYEEKTIKEVFVDISIAHEGKEYDIINPEYVKLRDKFMDNYFKEWKKTHSGDDDNFKKWKSEEWNDSKKAELAKECKKNKIEQYIKAHEFKKGINIGEGWSEIFNIQEFDVGFREDLSISDRRKIQNIYKKDGMQTHPVLALPDQFAEKDKDGKIVAWKFPSIDELVIYAMNRFNGNV